MAGSAVFMLLVLVAVFGHSEVDASRLKRSEEPGIEIDWNELLDGLFLLARQHILAENKDELSIPDVNETFEKKAGFLKLRGSFSANSGFVNSLSSIERTGDISLTNEANALVLTSHLGFGVLRVRYDHYTAEILGARTHGRISASVSSNSVRTKIKFGLRDDGCDVILEEVKVVDLGRFNVEISGLGALNWLFSKIATWVTDNKRDDIISRLDRALDKELRKAIDKFDCDKHFNKIRDQITKHLN